MFETLTLHQTDGTELGLHSWGPRTHLAAERAAAVMRDRRIQLAWDEATGTHRISISR